MFWIIVLTVLFLLVVLVYASIKENIGESRNIINKAKIKSSDNYRYGRFFTDESMATNITFSTFWKFFKSKKRTPHSEIPVNYLSAEDFEVIGKTRVIWFGHSAVMIEIADKRFITDPMLTDTPSPVKSVVNKRFSKIPISLEDFPKLDGIIISHDHYDHLDHDSIVALKDKTRKFFVPLGVGSHLASWGVPESKIVELDWFESIKFGKVTLTLTPTRHYTSRNFVDRNKKLWGSWIIKWKRKKIFFSGDSGYSKYFKTIGDKYGPFDLTLIECGQYHKQWRSAHMMPEDSIQAHIDLKGKVMLPIHWGAFILSLHNWKEPILRVSEESKKRGVTLTTPQIGEPITLGLGKKLPNEAWWENID